MPGTIAPPRAIRLVTKDQQFAKHQTVPPEEAKHVAKSGYRELRRSGMPESFARRYKQMLERILVSWR